VWHYGDGGFDRLNVPINGARNEEGKPRGA